MTNTSIENPQNAVQYEVTRHYTVCQQQESKKELHAYLTPIGAMIDRVEAEPPLAIVYPGIVEGSKAIVFGSPKSGKTMFCEGMLIANAAGERTYMGKPISFKNRRGLLISFEEHPRFRSARNAKQLQRLTPEQREAVRENYLVVNEGMPLYITTNENWQLLADVINSADPAVVVIDSLTHLYQGSIEDSSVAKLLTEKLQWLSVETNTTIIIIHHTHKLGGRPISMDTMAGSRVLAQEADTMIGVNRTGDGKHYIKEVAARYAPSISDTVTTFTIDANCWLNVTGQADEIKLLAALDGRRDSTNSDKIVAYLAQLTETETPTAASRELEARFVDTKEMGRTVLYDHLRQLAVDGKIAKSGSQYKLAG